MKTELALVEQTRGKGHFLVLLTQEKELFDCCKEMSDRKKQNKSFQPSHSSKYTRAVFIMETQWNGNCFCRILLSRDRGLFWI